MTQVNEEIKATVVQVVNKETKGLTKMSLHDAIALASETDEDVILLNWNNGLPIVKIENYSKYTYAEQKKKKEQAKKQRASSSNLKEIRMLYTIEEHDIGIKVKNIDRLLRENNRVKVSIIYKGRAIKMIRGGFDKLKYLEDKLTENHKVDGVAKIEGNRVVMTIIPAK